MNPNDLYASAPSGKTVDRFATRSEWKKNKIYPKPTNGLHVIGIDMGYSSPKCVFETGNLVFPNYCKQITGETFGKLPADAIIYIAENGDRYYVGDMAQRTLSEDSVVSEESLYGRNHYLHPEFKVIFETALGLSTWDLDSDGSNLYVQTGLPPAYRGKDEPYLRQALVGAHNFSLTVRGVTKAFHIALSDDRIGVMAQPMGTLNSLLFNDDGSYSAIAPEILRSDLMIFDCGFKTLDTFFIHANELADQTTNAQLGMYRVLDEARKMIRKEYGTPVSIPAMQKVLKTGTIQVNDLMTLTSKSYDVSDIIEKASAKVCGEAIDSVKDHLFEIKYLILTGGTGEAWYDAFSKRLAAAPITLLRGRESSSLPTLYANARGYYMSRVKKLSKGEYL